MHDRFALQPPPGRLGDSSAWPPSNSEYLYRIWFRHATIFHMDSSNRRQLIDQALVGYGGETPRPLGCPAPPTQARASRSATASIEAAIARFRVDGFAATKVDDVIADADVSWATFFRYFPRKDDVLIEAAARHFRDHVRPSAEASLADRRLKMSTVVQRLLVSLLQPADLPPLPSRGGIARDLRQPGQVRRPGRRGALPTGHGPARGGARRGPEARRGPARSGHAGRRFDHHRRSRLDRGAGGHHRVGSQRAGGRFAGDQLARNRRP